MKIYRCKRQFFCTPLKQYLPVGAHLGRYENAVRIVVNKAPRSDTNIYNVLSDGIVYETPNLVSWIYTVEPPPLGNNNTFFELVGASTEDAYGNVQTTSGLPVNSQLQIGASGATYMLNAVMGLWHNIRINGPDGNVYLEIEQTGIVAPV